MDSKPEISVIVPVSERFDEVRELYHAYKQGVEASGSSFDEAILKMTKAAAVPADLTPDEIMEQIKTLAVTAGE